MNPDSPLPLSDAALAEIRTQYTNNRPTWLRMEVWTVQVGGLLATIDQLRADLTAKESVIRSMTDPQGKEWAESVRISELEADLTAAQETSEIRKQFAEKWDAAYRNEHVRAQGLAERLEKAEAFARSFVGDYDAGMEFSPGELRMHVQEARAVLAAPKEACPKCKGRGFIRTLVDGKRDSEPCSYCRMSGRVMEEQR